MKAASLTRLVFALVLALPTCAVHAAGHAHVHGVARMDVAIDGDRLVVQLSSPLDNLVGFERAPRNTDERRRVDAAVALLRDGSRLLKPDAAAACRLESAELDSAALQLGHPDPSEVAEGHADIDASYTFRCAAMRRLERLDLSVLWSFQRMQRIEVQVAGPQGQFRRDLARPQGNLLLGRDR